MTQRASIAAQDVVLGNTESHARQQHSHDSVTTAGYVNRSNAITTANEKTLVARWLWHLNLMQGAAIVGLAVYLLWLIPGF